MANSETLELFNGIVTGEAVTSGVDWSDCVQADFFMEADGGEVMWAVQASPDEIMWATSQDYRRAVANVVDGYPWVTPAGMFARVILKSAMPVNVRVLVTLRE